MIALYLTQDSFGTACNVSGDNAVALIVDKVKGRFGIAEELEDSNEIFDEIVPANEI